MFISKEEIILFKKFFNINIEYLLKIRNIDLFRKAILNINEKRFITRSITFDKLILYYKEGYKNDEKFFWDFFDSLKKNNINFNKKYKFYINEIHYPDFIWFDYPIKIYLNFNLNKNKLYLDYSIFRKLELEDKILHYITYLQFINDFKKDYKIDNDAFVKHKKILRWLK